MERTMKTMIELKNYSSKILKERQEEIYQKILMKQERIYRHRKILRQIESCCSTLREEHSKIDRTLFFREREITIIRAKRKKQQMPAAMKDIEKMSKQEASALLEQLLALKNR